MLDYAGQFLRTLAALLTTAETTVADDEVMEENDRMDVDHQGSDGADMSSHPKAYYRGLKDENENLKTALTAEKKKRGDRKAAYAYEKKRLQKEVEFREDVIRNIRSSAEAQAQEHQRSLHAFQEYSARLKQEAQAARRDATYTINKLQHLEAEHASAIQLLDVRTAELNLAQQYLTTADSLSGADIIRMVEKMNADILQCAGHMAEKLPPEVRHEVANLDQGEAYHRLENVVGEKILDLLQASRAMNDPSMVLQIALQACLIGSSRIIISQWHEHTKTNVLFEDLYAAMRQAEEPAVSRQWRALTKSNVDRLHDEGETSLSSTLDVSISSNLSAIMTLAEYHDATHVTLMDKFRSELKLIMGSILELKKAIGEKITSCDMEIFSHFCETSFDPESMVDYFNNGPSNESTGTERVLCTVELGLTLGKSVTRDEKTEYVKDIILRPKVVLQSVIKDITASG